MKKLRLWSSLLIVAMLLLSFAGQGFAAEPDEQVSEEQREELKLEFNDAAEAGWAMESIGLMKSQNILSGYEDGSFRPNQFVSRVEAVVTAVRLMGLEEEAKAKPANERLHFADASMIDQQYKWAKGYVIVALEQGLFSTSESKLDPSKPASRIWVSALLVKALGLEKEALAQMTVVPDFKDVKDIPAGAIGYVNMAVEQGVIAGYPDETFKPNRNVTRAELATLLVRTNDNLLEQSGAITVAGKITALQFGGNQPADAAAGSSTYGSIAIESFNGDALVYSISAELPVPFYDRFIPASGLIIGDAVSLTVENGAVLKASFIDKELVNETTAGIREFELELEIDEDNGLKLEYENKNGKPKAEVEIKVDGDKEKLKGPEAIQQLEAFFAAVMLTPEMSRDDIQSQIFTALEVADNGFKEFEIEIRFSNGKKIEFEVENDEESAEEENLYGIDEFKLKAELWSGQKLKAEYKYDDGKSEAKMELDSQKLSGANALRAIAAFFEQVSITDDMSKDEIVEQALAYFEIEESAIKDLRLEIEFSNGKEVKIELEKDDDDDDN
ncbi:S-layer homology domain-containing protein [Paenibacillus sp. sgz302251]|uniref:S-layer homology domain-containing protein n=1 Tax=Paenibacillus sp. sgz302251 TaxID=3414493 RepID=UPI003C7EC352